MVFRKYLALNGSCILQTQWNMEWAFSPFWFLWHPQQRKHQVEKSSLCSSFNRTWRGKKVSSSLWLFPQGWEGWCQTPRVTWRAAFTQCSAAIEVQTGSFIYFYLFIFLNLFLFIYGLRNSATSQVSQPWPRGHKDSVIFLLWGRKCFGSQSPVPTGDFNRVIYCMKQHVGLFT